MSDEAAGRGVDLLVSDGAAQLTKALGIELDLTTKGFGLRCRRAAFVVDDGVVRSVGFDGQSFVAEVDKDLSALFGTARAFPNEEECGSCSA